MQLVILASLLLLTVGTAGADTMYLNFIDGNGRSLPVEVDTSVFESDELIQKQAACLAKMKAAMREMDKYIKEVKAAWQQEKLYPAGTMYFNSSKTFSKEFDEWEAAKRDCWKEKP